MPHLSRRRRVVLLVLVSLLAGAIVNVALAWGLSLRQMNLTWENDYMEWDEWSAPVPEDWPAPYMGAFGRQWGVTGSWAIARSSVGQDACELGWPCRSLQGWTLFWPDEPPPMWETATLTLRAELVREDHYLLRWGDRRIPLRPMWPGLLINTLLYASIPLAILFGPRQIRRLARLRRGACLRCGYDLRGLAEGVCPECGGER